MEGQSNALSVQVKIGRRKKKREVIITENPAKLVIKIEIKAAKINGDGKTEIRKNMIKTR